MDTKLSEQLPMELKNLRQQVVKYKQTDDLFNTLLKRSPATIWIAQDGKLQLLFQGLTNFTGYSKEELLGIDPLTIIHPDDRNAVRENCARMLKGERSLPYRYRVVTKSGETRFILESVSSIQYRGRSAVLGYAMNNTEQTEAEEKILQQNEALRESEQFSSSLLKEASNPIMVVNPDTSIRYVNPELEKLTGFSSVELVGKKVPYPYWPTEDRQQTIDEVMGFSEILRQRFYRHEKLRRRKDGTKFWIEITSAPVRRGDDLAYVLIIWNDITKRKIAEEKLTESEKLYSTLANSSPIGVFIVQGGKFVFANPQFCKISGYREEELMSLEPLSLVHPEDRGRVRENATRALRGKYTDSYEYRFLNKNGETRVILETIATIRYHGERASLGGFMDITERKQAQETEKRLSQELQAKISELETFSYGIAHDLRSPLFSIAGFSRLLQEDLQNQRMDEVQNDIRLLESGIEKMQKLLNGTLEYSRAGYMIKRTKDVSFGDIVEEVLDDLVEQIGSSGATISQAKSFPAVYVDRMRIKQVLLNLIQNSIKYRDKVRPLTIEIDYRLSGDEVVFCVRDNGVGIDDGETEKVFEIFYRGTAEGEGSGLGLAIVKKIIEAHGGKIWAESQPGKGTAMCFTLPQ